MTHGVKSLEPAGKHFVHVTLVTDVHHKSVTRGVEHSMQCDGQLNNPKIRAEVPPGLRENFDQVVAYFLRKLRQILFAQCFNVGRRTDSIQQALRCLWSLDGLGIFRRD